MFVKRWSIAVTRNDVARLAGVSTATVSYVINNGPRPVAAETRQRVLRAIDRLGYQPSAVARSLKTNRTLTVGVVIPDILNPIFALIAQSIEDALAESGYNLILCNTKESPESELSYLHMLRSKRVDGIVIVPTGANRSLLFSLIQLGIRMVVLDRIIEGLNASLILFQNEDGAHAGVQHLIELGHRRIGMISVPPGLTPGAGRLRGYECALRDAGLTLDPVLLKTGSFRAEEAYSLVRDMLTGAHPPTALFAANNRLARGVLQYLKQQQLRMPDDLALCVFDDVGYYSYITPSITAVGHDYQQCGREAARLLMESIKQGDDFAPPVVTLPYHLHVRESTAGRAGPPPHVFDSENTRLGV